MEISLITKLMNKIRYDCDACNEHKLLEYLVIDVKGNMYSICKECRDALLSGGSVDTYG